MTATSLLFLDHRAVERRKPCKTSRFPRDVARFFVSLSSAEGEPGRLAGDRRVYHGSAFPERQTRERTMKDVCALARKAGGSGVHLPLFRTRKIKTGGLRLPLHFGGPAQT